MPVVFILAIVASIYFRKEITRRGYESAQAVRYPLIAAAIAMFLQFLGHQVWRIAVPAMKLNPDLVMWLNLATDVFLTALFVAAIAKNWRIIKKLPSRGSRPDRPSPANG